MVKFRALTAWKKEEISRLFSRATSILISPEFDIRQAPASLSYGRLLIIIPKRVGSAPQRNLIRRRIKALFYENGWYNLSKDTIIFVKPKATLLDWPLFVAIFTKVFILVPSS